MKRVILVVIVFVVFLSGCAADKNARDKKSVFVSILPMEYFVKAITGDKMDVEVMVLPGKSPATYEPTTSQIVSLSEADVFFTIGVPFEASFITKISNELKKLSIINTSKGITKRHLGSHESLDPHVWMSVINAKTISENIFNAITNIDRKNADEYTKKYESLIKDLDDVDNELKELLVPYKGSKILVYHPAFGYLCDDYGLIQLSIEMGGKEPSPAHIEKIIKEAKENNIRFIFVQEEFPSQSAETIAKAINGSVIKINPLSHDYVNNIKIIAENIKKAAVDK